MSKILETVTYRINIEDEQAFLSANQSLADWVAAQSGYVSGSLARKEDGSLINIVIWADMDAAKSAGEKMMVKFGDSQFMKMVIPESVSMEYSRVLAG